MIDSVLSTTGRFGGLIRRLLYHKACTFDTCLYISLRLLPYVECVRLTSHDRLAVSPIEVVILCDRLG
jgi:hypothetical protein